MSLASPRSEPSRQGLLQDRLRFETLLSELSAKLIHIEASGLDAALEAALRQMVTFLEADRGNLDEYRDGAAGVRVSWAEPGVETLPAILAVEHLVWTADTLRRGAVVRTHVAQQLLEANVPDVGELREILADIVADDQRAAKVISRLRALLKGHRLDLRTDRVRDEDGMGDVPRPNGAES